MKPPEVERPATVLRSVRLRLLVIAPHGPSGCRFENSGAIALVMNETLKVHWKCGKRISDLKCRLRNCTTGQGGERRRADFGGDG